MKLSNYISDLLYRYECVIVPGFGGFVTNTKSAIISPYSKTFYPPHKLITFNSHLKNNDGLLANYIAAVDQVPYEHALNFIKFEVGQWYDIIKQTDLTLDSIGKFSLDSNNTILFEPQTEINYLTEAFGLSSFVLPEVKREVLLKESAAVIERPVQLNTKRNKESNAFLKYAAIFVIGLSLLGVGANSIYQKYLTEQQIIATKEEQKQIQTKIEKATFIVSEALPSIGVEVSLDKKPYHIVAGAFRYPENAQRLVNQLMANGYKAKILGVNKWGLTQVAYESYTEKNDAINSLYRIRETESDQDAWLLIQDL
ncbi:SPOR domain-containing protein [Aureibaculum marinum]|uniref:SPOR domain-containing protein n=1 Tax=Aureibaculum marinum TaxID=2487930 RepID=A0A3N4NM09_9FLAO|nr:SPOR domain-containing protein [Aureibaculum marinum]RPD96575.1 SPOR domain-containing protein [Aureibaculum marinum]